MPSKQAACKRDEVLEINKWMDVSERETLCRKWKQKYWDRNANCANTTCFFVLQLCFFFLFWLVVQFAKLNLTRNLFTPSGFSFISTTTTIRAHQHSLSYFRFRDFYQRWDETTKWQSRNVKKEWEGASNNPRHYRELNRITNTKPREKNVSCLW